MNNGQVPANIEIFTKNINIYPNPANDYFIIKAPQANFIEISDLLGKKYLSLSDPKGQIRIQTSSWSNGVYIVRVDDVVNKVIIQ